MGVLLMASRPAAQRLVAAGCAPARLSGTRPSLVNGTLCGAERCLHRQLALQLIRHLAVRPARLCNARCPRPPTEAGAAATAWYVALSGLEVVRVAHVADVRLLRRRSRPASSVPLQIEGVRVVHAHAQIERRHPAARRRARTTRSSLSSGSLQRVADGRRSRPARPRASGVPQHLRAASAPPGRREDTASSRMTAVLGVTWCHPERSKDLPAFLRHARTILRSARDDPRSCHSSPLSAFFRSHHAIRSATFFSYPNAPGL